MLASTSSRLSGTSTIAVFGSTVLKAYEATPAPARVSALNNVVFPTLGRPTIPTPRLIGQCYTRGNPAALTSADAECVSTRADLSDRSGRRDSCGLAAGTRVHRSPRHTWGRPDHQDAVRGSCSWLLRRPPARPPAGRIR